MFLHKKSREGMIKQYTKDEIPKEPLPLPPGFEWQNFDVKDNAAVEEICKFLEGHYVEDDLGNFKVRYTPDKF